eukprot:3265698-Rhodomonas_salina.2
MSRSAQRYTSTVCVVCTSCSTPLQDQAARSTIAELLFCVPSSQPPAARLVPLSSVLVRRKIRVGA